MDVCRKPYPSDVSEEEWLLIMPYLLVQREDAWTTKQAIQLAIGSLSLDGKTERTSMQGV